VDGAVIVAQVHATEKWLGARVDVLFALEVQRGVPASELPQRAHLEVQGVDRLAVLGHADAVLVVLVSGVEGAAHAVRGCAEHHRAALLLLTLFALWLLLSLAGHSSGLA